MSLILNVDADEILYNAAFAAEKTHYTLTTKNGNEYNLGAKYTGKEIKQMLEKRGKSLDVDYKLTSYKLPLGDAGFARQNAKRILTKLRSLGDLRLFLTGSTNFRIDMAKTPGPRGPGYKANRPSKPIFYNETKEYLINRWGAEIVEDMEADDALGVWQRSNTVAVHIDKDINRISGKHLNWKTGERYVVPEGLGALSLKKDKLTGVGNIFFFAQMLLGDRVDNIPGIDGYGDKGVFSLLNTCGTERDALLCVMDCYENNYGEDYLEILLEVADLLYIMDGEKIRGREYIKRVWSTK